MNHNEITNTDVIEQYVLGELDKEQVREFEAHLFGCNECLEELQRTELAIREIQLAAHAQSSPRRLPIIDTISDWLIGVRLKPVFALLLVLLAIYFIPGMLKSPTDHGLGTFVPKMQSTFLIENDETSNFTVARDAQFQIQINLNEIAEPTRGTMIILDSDNKPVWETENAVIDPNARYTLTLDASQLQESTFTFQCISSDNEILLKRFFSVQFK